MCEDLIPDFSHHQEEALTERSVIFWAGQLPPIPILLLHGTADDRVDYGQILPFADSLEHYQIPYKLISFEGDNHGCTAHQEEVMALLKSWFHTNLRSLQKYIGSERQVVAQ